MLDFKNEMREFKDEMLDFKNEMREFKNEMREFKDEMREFKDEMREFKDEMRDFKTEMNKKWGELSNKMGTMAEDLVAPSIGRIFKETVGCPDDRIDWQAVRFKARNQATGQQREFDVVALCGDYLLINETKSNLRSEDLAEFVDLLANIRDYFPRYQEKQVVGSIGSLYVDNSLVRYGERLGLIVLGMGDHLMQVLNSPEFSPRPF
ncbi:MAG: hypothetical protein R2911_18865 [Caldilineaceae bacterium]